jgi:hypothetical protein
VSGGARDTEADASIRQHTPAYVSIRQHTSGGARDSGFRASEAELAGQLGLEEAVEGGSEAHAGLSGAHCRLLLSPEEALALSPPRASERERERERASISVTIERERQTVQREWRFCTYTP